MTKTIFIILFSLLKIVSFGQTKTDTAIVDHYKTKQFDCAIFTSNFWVFLEGKRFTPIRTDIDKAELELTKQLKDLVVKLSLTYKDDDISFIPEYLNSYGRQYFGYIDSKGHRILYINSLWIDNSTPDSIMKDFLKDIILVNDGGSDYWNIKFDIDTGKLFDLHVNGTA